MQSNNKFEERQRLLKLSEAKLMDLLFHLCGEDVDDIELAVSELHTKFFSKRVDEAELFKRQQRRVPHGVIPDTPIVHPSNYKS